MLNHSELNAMQIIESNMLSLGMSDIPAKIHGKKRIQKKYIKKYGYRPIPDPNIYIYGDKIIGHPIIIKKLKSGL